MGLIDYKKLPIIKSFKDLKRYDKVYSKKHGLGTIIYFYKDQIIVGFGNFRKRLSECEEDLREIPINWLSRIRSRAKVNVNGQEMSLSAFKRERILEKRRARLLSKIQQIKGSSKVEVTPFNSQEMGL